MNHAKLSTRHEDGNITVAFLVMVVVAVLGMLIAQSVQVQTKRTNTTIDDINVVQRVDAAVSDAVSRLTADQSVPATRSSAITDCQVIDSRPVCYQYWALPIPGNATDPTRYTLIVNTWVDTNRDQQPPANERDIHASSVSLEAITYQTGAGVGPTSVNGRIVYQATPKALFGNAIHGFSSTLLNGPSVKVTSNNRLTGDNNTGNGVVSTSGWAMYGTDIELHRTLLFGREGESGGVTTTRCTGEPCEESNVTAVEHSYAKATEQSVQWMDGLACTSRVDGNWVASERAGTSATATISTPVLCIDGAMIVDTPVEVTIPRATVVVKGAISVEAHLNGTGRHSVANPGKLFIYSQGQSLTVNPVMSSPAAEGETGQLLGTEISAMIWAPRAVCSTNPGNLATSGSDAGVVTYRGSLVCDTVSLGANWQHQYEDSALIDYVDPVPGAKKAWTVGPYDAIDTDVKWDEPQGWEAATCILPAPSHAAAYWKLSEPSGLLAKDSVSTNDGAWAQSGSGRGVGLCGKGANLTSSGQVTSPGSLQSINSGVTIEWWGNDVVGTPVSSAGVTVSMDDLSKITVASDGVAQTFPFTVQNHDRWHLYTVSVAHSGEAKLYVDGTFKEQVTVGSPRHGGSSVMAAGDTGVINDVVVYLRTLNAGEVADRWATWNQNVPFEVSDPGTPFTEPTNVRDNGSDPATVKIAWDASGGTFPAPDATYRVQRSATEGGTYTEIGSVNRDTLTFTQDDPLKGAYWFRVCAQYNGDVLCSTSIRVVTVPNPVAPTVRFDSSTSVAATFSWNAQEFATGYQVQHRVNGGDWETITDQSSTTRTITGLAANTQVDVRVRTVNPAGTSGWSTVVAGYTTPTAPVVSVSSSTATSVSFTWPAIPYRTRYEYQTRVNDGAWTAVTNTTGTTVSVTGRSANQKVDIQVRTVNPAGTSGWSTVVAGYTTPTAPVVSAGTSTTTSATFTWPAIPYRTRYEYQTRVNGGAWSGVTNTTTATVTVTSSNSARIDIQVRTVNPAGTSGWSTVTTNYLTPPAPSVSLVSVTNTNATFSWPAIPNRTRYEYQSQANGGTWTSVANTTGTQVTVNPSGSTQGDRIGIRVRTVAPNGTTSAWSSVVSGLTTIAAPTLERDTLTDMSDYPLLGARLTGVNCPAGTDLQSRGQRRWAGESWPGFGAWATTGMVKTTLTYSGTNRAYDDTLAVSIQVRCINTNSGRASSGSGSVILTGIRHDVPRATGLTVNVGGTGEYYRRAAWSASCGAYTSVRYNLAISAAWGSVHQTGVTTTSYSRTNDAWGPGYVSVTAYCVANSGGRQSANINTQRNFG